MYEVYADIESYNDSNAVYVSDYFLEPVPNWYEMKLMSLCKHNIIANSTFNWWGYLNRNPAKMVIAPSKWMQNIEESDICPEEWIRI